MWIYWNCMRYITSQNQSFTYMPQETEETRNASEGYAGLNGSKLAVLYKPELMAGLMLYNWALSG